MREKEKSVRWKQALQRKWRCLTLRQKLTALFLLTTVIVLAVNLYMFTLINEMTGKVEEVYVSNVSLNDLSGALDQVQKSMEEYLNTKSSDAMEDYYRSEQNYRKMMESLNSRATDNKMLLTEKISADFPRVIFLWRRRRSRPSAAEMWSVMESSTRTRSFSMMRFILLSTA